MLKYAVIGYPIKHSLSPKIHNPAFASLEIDAHYEKIEVHPDDLKEKISELRLAYAGWNVTVPHKKNVLSLLDDLSPLSRLAESVNTVINKDGKLFGDSTDGYGLEKSVNEEFNYPVKSGKFLFIGAGGVAEACAIDFAFKGASIINIVNRSRWKMELIAHKIKENFPRCQVGICDFDDEREKNSFLVCRS